MRGLFLFMVTFSGGCALSARNDCKHSVYDAAWRDEVVIPYLEDQFGDGYRFFNYENPLISIKENKVAYVFDSSKTIDGKNLRYEKSIYFIRSCNSGEIIEIAEVGNY